VVGTAGLFVAQSAFPQSGSHPNVSELERAKAYLAWLCARPGHDYRWRATEWEYAARAGSGDRFISAAMW